MPSVKVNHNTTYTVTETVDGIQHEFEVELEPSEYHTLVKISEDGRRAVVGFLCQDDDGQNPREECDNVGTMVCWHGRHNLGDEQRTDDASDWFLEMAMQADGTFEDWKYRQENKKGDWRKIEGHIQEKARAIVQKNYVMLPLYLYDHSGITMSTGPFSCQWDSGQVGWIYATKEKVLEEWGGGSKRLTAKIKAQALKYLEGEVETYDQYLTGDVWGVCSQLFVNVAEEGDDPEWERFEEEGIIGYSGNNADGSHNPIYGDKGRDECWGFFGSKWAETEMADRVKYYEGWLSTPLPAEKDDPDQLDLALDGGGI